VSGVGPAQLFRDAAEAGVESAGDQVAEGRAGARALGEAARAGGDVEGLAVEGGDAARGFGAEEGEDRGDGRRVAELLEAAADAGEGDRGEEVGQVGVEDDGP